MTDDYNGSKQEGFGAMEQTIHRGRRWSAANAYLRPALRRKNVSLISGFARRVVIENHRAIGVEIEARKQIQVVKARREVIIAASSINSPKILMLSGIGPAAHLKEHGIEVVADRPGVGQNLQDHMELYIQQESIQPITLYSKLNLFSKALIGAEWLFFKTGLGATNHFESAAFVRSAPGVDYPDIQYHFIPAAVRYDGKAAAKSHGFQAHVGPMRSKSRGAVTLRSADPLDQTGNPLQLHVACRRLGGFSPLHPADARDFRPGGVRSLSRQGDLAGQPCAERRGTRRLHPRARRKRLSSLRHLPDGSVKTTDERRRSGMPRYRRRRACASPTPRSFRASPTATSMRRRS